jgi:hypothetical protein
MWPRCTRDGYVAVPVTVTVVDDPGVHRLVVAFTQLGQPVRVQGGLATGLGGLDGGVGVGQGERVREFV